MIKLSFCFPNRLYRKNRGLNYCKLFREISVVFYRLEALLFIQPNFIHNLYIHLP